MVDSRMGDENQVDPLQISRLERGLFEVGVYENMKAAAVNDFVSGDT